MQACFKAVEADIEFLSTFPYFKNSKHDNFQTKDEMTMAFQYWLDFISWIQKKGSVNFD